MCVLGLKVEMAMADMLAIQQADCDGGARTRLVCVPQVQGSGQKWTAAGEQARNKVVVLPGIFLEAAVGGLVSAAAHHVIFTSQFSH